MKTKDRNKKRKAEKRAALKTSREISQSFMWSKFDTMTYARKVKR